MKQYKLLYYTKDKNGKKTCHSMTGFGHGYSLNEAKVLKAHLELEGYLDVKIVDFHYTEG